MTWIEVVDSAIKIGFGVVIASLFTFLKDYFDTKRSALKDYGQYKRNLLNHVLDQTDDFYKAQADYFSSLALKSENMLSSPTIIDPSSALQNFRQMSDEIIRVDGRLYSLNEVELYRAFRSYIELAINFNNKTATEYPKPLPVEELKKYTDEIKGRRKEFIQIVGAVIKQSF